MPLQHLPWIETQFMRVKLFLSCGCACLCNPSRQNVSVSALFLAVALRPYATKKSPRGGVMRIIAQAQGLQNSGSAAQSAGCSGVERGRRQTYAQFGP